MMETNASILPSGFTVRRQVVEDLPALTELARVCEAEDDGTPETTLEELRFTWQSSFFDPLTDAWTVLAPEGQLVGSVAVVHYHPTRLNAYGDVHPAYRGRGIGTYLLQLAEERAYQLMSVAPAGTRVVFTAAKSANNVTAQRLFEQHGMQVVRSFWRMAIELNVPPPAAQWDAGIQLRPFTLDMMQAVYEADEEAFKDHWSHLPLSFEDWQYWSVQRENFDPSWWFLAMDGDEIAGFALCEDAKENGGWVQVLGVRRLWRRRGIGLALLYHAFAEFYRRGICDVYLGVDAQSLTGATRLYERAGMHVDRQSNRYVKELRAGKELSIQSLEA